MTMTMESIFTTPEIVILTLLIVLIILIIFFDIQAHSSDCSGRIVSQTKAPDGQTCSREARLSIHDHDHDHHV